MNHSVLMVRPRTRYSASLGHVNGLGGHDISDEDLAAINRASVEQLEAMARAISAGQVLCGGILGTIAGAFYTFVNTVRDVLDFFLSVFGLLDKEEKIAKEAMKKARVESVKLDAMLKGEGDALLGAIAGRLIKIDPRLQAVSYRSYRTKTLTMVTSNVQGRKLDLSVDTGASPRKLVEIAKAGRSAYNKSAGLGNPGAVAVFAVIAAIGLAILIVYDWFVGADPLVKIKEERERIDKKDKELEEQRAEMFVRKQDIYKAAAGRELTEGEKELIDDINRFMGEIDDQRLANKERLKELDEAEKKVLNAKGWIEQFKEAVATTGEVILYSVSAIVGGFLIFKVIQATL